jgi:hypothetical protein
MTWADARAAAALVRREYQLSCRGAAFWTIAAGGAALAFWRASGPASTAAMAAYQTWRISVLGLGVLAILVGSAAAARDQREGASELVLSKELGTSPSFVVARFLGIWLSLMSIVVIMLAVASLRQVMGGTPWHVGAYANALVRTLAPMGLATALGFSLTTLFANALAGGVAAVYWVAVPLVSAHLSRAADMTLTQHWPAPALLSGGLIALTATLHGRWLRGRGPGRALLGWLSALLFACAAVVVVSIALDGEDALSSRDPVLSAMATQRVLPEKRAPGFWSPDGEGRLVGMSDLDGRPIALAFWGPGDPESAQVLALLKAAADKFRSADLACVAICVDSDSATVGPFARETGPEVVMLWDRGQHYGDGERWSDSPLGLAYEVRDVPTIFVLDRQRRLVTRIESHALNQLDADLEPLVKPS